MPPVVKHTSTHSIPLNTTFPASSEAVTQMARLSVRFSALFKQPRRSRSTIQSTSLKNSISKPIIAGEDDTHTLLASPSHAHTHSTSSSVYTISDAELRALEARQLGLRIADSIDDIIASYASTPCTTPLDPFEDGNTHCGGSTSAYRASPSPSSTYSESSVYSPPPPSPNDPAERRDYATPTLKATLSRFKDTPPPAPAWDKVSFGRETGLFGPDALSDVSCADFVTSGAETAHGCARFGGEAEGRAGRRRDWRREVARREGEKGYVML